MIICRLSKTNLAPEAFLIKDKNYSVISCSPENLITKKGDKLNFQNYFVEKKAKPRLSKVVYEGSRKASSSNQVIDFINQSDVLIVGPSNPILSIGPILSISRINQSIQDHNNVIAISPFVGKKALKGPSVQNFIEIWTKIAHFRILQFYWSKMK